MTIKLNGLSDSLITAAARVINNSRDESKNLEEISNKTLGSYMGKAADERDTLLSSARRLDKMMQSGKSKLGNYYRKIATKRQHGIFHAAKKLGDRYHPSVFYTNESIIESYKKPDPIDHHLGAFQDISGSGMGDLGSWHWTEFRKHAKTISPEHKAAVHKAIVNDMKGSGDYTRSQEKTIGDIYKPSLKEEIAEAKEWNFGDKVKFAPDYSRGDETFTVRHTDSTGRKVWVADKQGRGWYAHHSQLISARSRPRKTTVKEEFEIVEDITPEANKGAANYHVVNKTGKIHYKGSLAGARTYKDNLTRNLPTTAKNTNVMDTMGNYYDAKDPRDKITVGKVVKSVKSVTGAGSTLHNILNYGGINTLKAAALKKLQPSNEETELQNFIDESKKDFHRQHNQNLKGSVIHPMGLHITNVDGPNSNYKVVKVGSKVRDIKVGEHLTDTELDDAVELGHKIKHINEAKENDHTGDLHSIKSIDFNHHMTMLKDLNEGRKGSFNAGSASYFKAGQIVSRNIAQRAAARRKEEAEGKALDNLDDHQGSKKGNLIHKGFGALMNPGQKKLSGVKEELADTGTYDNVEMATEDKQSDRELGHLLRKKVKDMKPAEQKRARDLMKNKKPSMKAEEVEADQNILVHLRKTIDTQGNHTTVFANREVAEIPAEVAESVFEHMMKLKPEARVEVQTYIQESFDNILEVYALIEARKGSRPTALSGAYSTTGKPGGPLQDKNYADIHVTAANKKGYHTILKTSDAYNNADMVGGNVGKGDQMHRRLFKNGSYCGFSVKIHHDKKNQYNDNRHSVYPQTEDDYE